VKIKVRRRARKRKKL